MSLTSAMHSAMSGLAAAGRASVLVSENIANASTPGYGRRSLETSADSVTGSGVRVVGVTRHHDPALTANRRIADAEHAEAGAKASFLTGVQSLVGSATDADSIAARMVEFENSLTKAASAPESQIRLDEVAHRANDVARSISSASEGVQSLRSKADKTIDGMVDTVNDRLSRIETLNAKIVSVAASGRDTASLVDQRQLLVDEVNEIIPVNVVNRSNGRIGLYAAGGAILLDGSAAQLSFENTHMIQPEMNVSSGTLSQLKMNDTLVDIEALKGGELQAQFQIRDELAVEVQNELDTLAKDLITRFEAVGVDPTRPAGSAGLFTDAGNPLDPNDTVGLSKRLELNERVDPSSGDSWRLRDGLGAATSGPVGNAVLLNNLSDALTGPSSASNVAGDLIAGVTAQSTLAQQKLGFAATAKTEMTRLEQEVGVNTDAELQSLMIVERAYAANARVVQAVDEMMQSLLRI